MSSTEPQKATSSEQPPPYDTTQQQPQQVVYPPPPHQAGVTTVVMTQPGGVYLPMVYGPNPISMTCPHCQAAVVTATTYEPGVLTWLVCGGVALMGFWCGCCLIPFCVNDLQDCRHTCPNCKNFLGVYRRI